jgi:hypothetical protein
MLVFMVVVVCLFVDSNIQQIVNYTTPRTKKYHIDRFRSCCE